MCVSKKLRRQAICFLLIFATCFGSSAQNALYETIQLPVKVLVQEREESSERNNAFFKDKNLEWLLYVVQMMRARNEQENTEKQLYQLFNQGAALFYSCPSNNSYLDEKFLTLKSKGGSCFEEENQKCNSDVRDISSRISKANNQVFGIKDYVENSQAEGIYKKVGCADDADKSDDFNDLSSKTLYKTGYNFILSSDYVEAEKVFCAFQNLYREDPLSGDALFWLAESLLGQKRYREAAQLYLMVWYEDKNTLYGSEILLKLAISMAALDQHEVACALFADIEKHYKTLESVFDQRLKKEQSHSKCSLN